MVVRESFTRSGAFEMAKWLNKNHPHNVHVPIIHDPRTEMYWVKIYDNNGRLVGYYGEV